MNVKELIRINFIEQGLRNKKICSESLKAVKGFTKDRILFLPCSQIPSYEFRKRLYRVLNQTIYEEMHFVKKIKVSEFLGLGYDVFFTILFPFTPLEKIKEKELLLCFDTQNFVFEFPSFRKLHFWHSSFDIERYMKNVIRIFLEY